MTENKNDVYLDGYAPYGDIPPAKMRYGYAAYVERGRKYDTCSGLKGYRAGCALHANLKR